MPHYKLTYFDIQGRAEIARFLFALADEKYEDVRIPFEQWPAMKNKTPFGALPLLEVDGFQLCQSQAINRYLANQLGFAGSSLQEKARVDMIVECCEDMVKPFSKANFDKDEEAKKAGLKKFEEKELPESLIKFEKLLKKHNNGNTYFIRDAITWADVTVFQSITWLREKNNIKISFCEVPKLEAFLKRVSEHPKIAEWIAKRPKTSR